MGGAMGESDKTPRRSAKKARCAIYTRKSPEEGLEQAFNSLDAQREACAAFILSQKHEGWTVLPTLYDDGGYSGGTMERPALKRLIAATSTSSLQALAGRANEDAVWQAEAALIAGQPPPWLKFWWRSALYQVSMIMTGNSRAPPLALSRRPVFAPPLTTVTHSTRNCDDYVTRDS